MRDCRAAYRKGHQEQLFLARRRFGVTKAAWKHSYTRYNPRGRRYAVACEYPQCPCQRLCSFTGDIISPAESIHCHVHVHAGHAHVHTHAPEPKDEEMAQLLVATHAHQDIEAVYRYISFNAYERHEEEWHGKEKEPEGDVH